LGAHNGASYLITLKAQLKPLEELNKVMSTPPLMPFKQINHSILKSTPSPPMDKSVSSIEIITNQFSKRASPSRKKSSPYSRSSVEIIKKPQDSFFKQLSSTTNFQGLYPSGVEYWAPINIQLNRLIQNSTTYSYPRIKFEGNSLTPYGLDPNWKISTQFIAPDGKCQFQAVSFWKNETSMPRSLNLVAHQIAASMETTKPKIKVGNTTFAEARDSKPNHLTIKLIQGSMQPSSPLLTATSTLAKDMAAAIETWAVERKAYIIGDSLATYLDSGLADERIKSICPLVDGLGESTTLPTIEMALSAQLPSVPPG